MIGTRWRRFLLGAAAPVGALAFSVVITSLLLVTTGHSPAEAFGAMAGAFERSRIILGTVNQSAIYYLSAVAVAIGFKMNLFNIGVDGQYRLAAMLSAAVAGAAWMSSLPGFLRVAITLLVAMAVGAAWAGVAALLKVTRGVSEVISTIMLNAIATFIIAYLLTPQRLAVLDGNNISTPKITEGGQLPVIEFTGSTTPLYSLVLLALLVGVLYALMLSRTVFGFSLKATGLSESAAIASGISVKRMVVSAMLLSGAVAGLIGMPELLNGTAASYSLNFPTGIGFTGIAIALLGRNHPVGMIFSALLWAALDSSANALQGVGVPRELVTIMQGVIVLSVVVAYEFVRRYRLTLEAKDVARALAAKTAPAVATKGASS
ncbi:ABC transporter permease [Nakamurella multipartita]|mgnify:CR=1 FL=1|jgi:simple sugar transport system permease protein|uniref:Inner-membrane translocator n=1 Tax=Nakamurella multipartita (strain ATCC 700099 / DSM 44233 / CIP 104796 / JCM 9543 / NBRC 105858 / Y-104) TaxID=479431 RepID=C8XDQ3_NAKMY|nr:ABC transporter permease [Nakamurella multipartita]ACV77717.1 inner-membrane translocator [Nakamurella multipartita DSM 44233]